ncbi:hypothetical protein JCM3766R1_004520 [Sporobolomyces carnicolor]
MSNDLPPHSIAPTHSSTTSLRHKPHRSSRLVARGGGQNDDSDEDVGTSFERSIMSLANSASKAVRAQGVCSSDATCGGFIQFAQICSEREDSAAIAGCICSATSLQVMNACTNCISSNSVKENANRFSSFCNSASSTLALLAATSTSSTSSSPSATSTTSHSSASRSIGELTSFVVLAVAAASVLV